MGVFHHWWVGSYDDWAAGGGSSELSGRKAVAYAGTTVEVSEDWPVHDVTAEPHTCIRIPVSGMPATRWTSAIAAYADMAWYAHWPGPRGIKQYRGRPHRDVRRKMLDIDLNVVNAPVATWK